MQRSYAAGRNLTTGIALILILTSLTVCRNRAISQTVEAMDPGARQTKKPTPFFKLSLAQWSMHRMILEGNVDPYQFAAKAKGWGFDGLEYVSALYKNELEPSGYSAKAMQQFVDKCNLEATRYGLENLLIMVDGEGDLAASDTAARHQAVANHYKWIDAASAMGCHSIRVNLWGSDNPSQWLSSSVDSLTRLCTYARNKSIHVLVENHGGFSSNAQMLASVIKEVGMENCGTLPDFGNFCIRKHDPKDFSSGCAEMYDRYNGVEELMPYARAVSAKSYDFDAQGNETKIDFYRMLSLIKAAGYKGYIGVEYEGNQLEEVDGIKATRDLLLNAESLWIMD